MPCVEGKCVGYNEQRNLFNAGRHFTTFLLPHGAPVLLRPTIDQLVEAYEQLTMDSGQLVDKLGKVVDMYTRGWYLNRSSSHQQKPGEMHCVFLLLQHNTEPLYACLCMYVCVCVSGNTIFYTTLSEKKNTNVLIYLAPLKAFFFCWCVRNSLNLFI